MLWRDSVIGWSNVSVDQGVMDVEVGYAKRAKRDKSLAAAIDEERSRMAAFLRAK